MAKQKKFLDALQDAKNALELDGKSVTAFFRKGCALFELEEYEGALAAFEEGDKLESKDHEKWQLWIRKCKAEIENEAGEGEKETSKKEKETLNASDFSDSSKEEMLELLKKCKNKEKTYAVNIPLLKKKAEESKGNNAVHEETMKQVKQYSELQEKNASVKKAVLEALSSRFGYVDPKPKSEEDEEGESKKAKREEAESVEKKKPVFNVSYQTDEPPATLKTGATALPTKSKIRHEWYQTDAHVVVTVFCKGLTKERITQDIDKESVSLTLKLDDDSEWQIHLDLAGEIVPEDARLDILSTKAELWLKKRYLARWSDLEKKEGTLITPQPGVLLSEVPSKKVEPYASKKKVNWDKFIAEQDDLDDDDPLNKVFKDIYGKGSAEQQRAMMKSYVESGGTVLSTNWEDVGSKKVEVSPPDGMIAKQWGTDEVVAEGGERKKKK